MQLFKLLQAFLVVFATHFVTLITCAGADISETNPFHLSWKQDLTRFDFVFSLHGPLKNNTRPTSDTTYFVTKTLNEKCVNHSACLFENGTFLQLFDYDEIQSSAHKSIFLSKSSNPKQNHNSDTSSATYMQRCGEESLFTVFHYCSTHWNPPSYLNRFECAHTVEWHSPITCHKNTTNHEQPCYIYNSDGQLIDLTTWILSDGGSYLVDTSMITNTTIKEFHLNICNDAHKSCAPDVASCLLTDRGELIETGFNSRTSLKYVKRENATHLVTQGQVNPLCRDSRVKTTVKFKCGASSPSNKPKLLKNTPCENIIEWESIHACPMDEIKTPATNCRIRHNLLGVELDLHKMSANHSTVLVNNIKVDGQLKDMQLGICNGLPVKEITCEGQHRASTSACLIDNSIGSSVKTRDNSKIVGSIMKSYIKLTDDRVHLESMAVNKSCSITQGPHFNITKPLGTRIEFFCAPEQAEKPEYLGFDDCVYVFEWGTPIMCLEHAPLRSKEVALKDKSNSKASGKEESSSNKPTVIVPTHNDDKYLSPEEKHKFTLDDAKKILDPAHNTSAIGLNNDAHTSPLTADTTKNSSNSQSNKPNLVDTKQEEQIKPKMGNLQKVFMIGLIVMSLSAFIITIFILDKKTRLRVPIAAIRRRAGQAFQPVPVPYSRVNRFNDSLDL